MTFQLRLLILSVIAGLGFGLPFFLHHNFPLEECILWTVGCIVAGLLCSWGYVARAKHFKADVIAEWQYCFVIFPTTFAWIMQAILKSYMFYQDTEKLFPTDRRSVFQLCMGIVAMVVCFGLPQILCRVFKDAKSNQI